MPDFFINRPIFAWVVALLISLVGLLAIPMLPVAQYPDIAPPVITIRTTYPGASAQITEESPPSLKRKSTARRACCTCPPPATPTAWWK